MNPELLALAAPAAGIGLGIRDSIRTGHARKNEIQHAEPIADALSDIGLATNNLRIGSPTTEQLVFDSVESLGTAADNLATILGKQVDTELFFGGFIRDHAYQQKGGKSTVTLTARDIYDNTGHQTRRTIHIKTKGRGQGAGSGKKAPAQAIHIEYEWVEESQWRASSIAAEQGEQGLIVSRSFDFEEFADDFSEVRDIARSVGEHMGESFQPVRDANIRHAIVELLESRRAGQSTQDTAFFVESAKALLYNLVVRQAPQDTQEIVLESSKEQVIKKGNRHLFRRAMGYQLAPEKKVSDTIVTRTRLAIEDEGGFSIARESFSADRTDMTEFLDYDRLTFFFNEGEHNEGLNCQGASGNRGQSESISVTKGFGRVWTAADSMHRILQSVLNQF